MKQLQFTNHRYYFGTQNVFLWGFDLEFFFTTSNDGHIRSNHIHIYGHIHMDIRNIHRNNVHTKLRGQPQPQELPRPLSFQGHDKGQGGKHGQIFGGPRHSQGFQQQG